MLGSYLVIFLYKQGGSVCSFFLFAPLFFGFHVFIDFLLEFD